jgi:hypothetical protein
MISYVRWSLQLGHLALVWFGNQDQLLTKRQCLQANQYCSMIASLVKVATNHYRADVDWITCMPALYSGHSRTCHTNTGQGEGMLQASSHQPCHNLSVTQCLGWDNSLWPGVVQCSELRLENSPKIPPTRSGNWLLSLRGKLCYSIK